MDCFQGWYNLEIYYNDTWTIILKIYIFSVVTFIPIWSFLSCLFCIPIKPRVSKRFLLNSWYDFDIIWFFSLEIYSISTSTYWNTLHNWPFKIPCGLVRMNYEIKTKIEPASSEIGQLMYKSITYHIYRLCNVMTIEYKTRDSELAWIANPVINLWN